MFISYRECFGTGIRLFCAFLQRRGVYLCVEDPRNGSDFHILDTAELDRQVDDFLNLEVKKFSENKRQLDSVLSARAAGE